jgi:hypothetical protein
MKDGTVPYRMTPGQLRDDQGRVGRLMDRVLPDPR